MITFDQFFEVSRNLLWISMGLLTAKTILGIHWNWETCSCCGKKYKNHVNTSELATFLPRWENDDEIPF